MTAARRRSSPLAWTTRLLVIPALALLFVLPAGTLGAPVPGPAQAPTDHASGAAPAVPTPPGGVLPGTEPSGVPVDGPRLYRLEGSSVLGAVSNGTGRPSADRASPAAAPRPAASRAALSIGNVTGTVLDSVRGTPVAFANVSTSAPNGACGTCGASYWTNASGGFDVPAPAGSAIMTITAPSYQENETFVSVPAGGTVDVGVIDLVHFATVYGTIVADLPGAPPLADAPVTSSSRDGGVVGPNATGSGPTGEFFLAVDALPIVVQVAPPGSDYLPNQTYADPAPWANVSLGTIALEGGVMLNVSVVDALTGYGVPNASVEFCSERIDGACLGTSLGGPGPFRVPAVAGAGFLSAVAPGYVTNITPSPDVPVGTAGPVAGPTIRLIPDGAVEVTVNFTGGAPGGVWPAALPNETSLLVVLACTLSGESAGDPGPYGIVDPICLETPVHLGVTTLVPATPLRDVVFVARDGGLDPVPNGFPVGEVPFVFNSKYYPTLRMLNTTWANVTPDEVTEVGSVDVSPGTYVSGTLAPPSGTPLARNVSASVQVCSTVRVGECSPPVTTGAAGPPSGAAGCPNLAWTFCAPAPPGPDLVQISWGPSKNSTWVTVPFRCCAQEGHPTPLGTFGLSGDLGAVFGTVRVAGAPAGVVPGAGPAGGVAVCPSSPGISACYGAPYNGSTGAFQVLAPVGWDEVTASAQYFRSNSTWIDVVRNNTTGVIELTPDALVEGRLLSATSGRPLAEAQVEACPVATPTACLAVATTGSTDGTYNGTLPALPYPAAAYLFTATAAGYDPETTFANVTPGVLSVVPTMRLAPVGTLGGLAPARSAGSASPTTGSWVTGRLVDAATGLGVGDAQMQVCPLSGTLGCNGAPVVAGADGGFNLSTVHGAYELWVNASAYATDHVYLNASTAGTVALGAVAMTPLPRLVGRIAIGPWSSLLDVGGIGADQVRLVACDPGGDCGPTGVTDSGGFFNASVPLGTPDRITLTGGGADDSGNGDTGYTVEIAVEDVAGGTQTLLGSGPGGVVDLPILGGWSGQFTAVAGTNASAADFVSYQSYGNASAGSPVVGRSGPGGTYTAFLPGGASPVQLEADALGLEPTASALPNPEIAPGVVTAGPRLNLTRFGVVTATLRVGGTGEPVGGETVASSGASPLTGFPVGASGVSNGSGAVEVPAAPGFDQLVAGGIAYANWSDFVTVAAGATVALRNVSLSPLADGGLVTVRTVAVNDVAVPPTPGVRDNATGAPVVGLYASEELSGNGAVGPVLGNDLGQFFLDGYPDLLANTSLQATGYSALTVGTPLGLGATAILANLTMVPDGIVAGRVEAIPGNASVPYAEVVVCPTTEPTCGNVVETNESGVFWAAAPAGLDAVVVESNTYLTNLSRLVAVPSDGFVELGAVDVYAFGTVRGIVRALPSGALVAGANVTLCSPFSPPNGCLADASVATDANGTFAIQIPPSSYVLAVSAPGTNTTWYDLAIPPGADIDLGIVFVQQDGVLDGTVVNTSGAPVAGAVVLACGTWSGSVCPAPAFTNASGAFALATDPGPTALTVTAGGYLDGDVVVDAVSGHTLDVVPIVLSPVPPSVPENVSGSVLVAATDAPLADALVVAWEGGGRIAQTLTSSNGSFALSVRWGTVALYAGLAGYASANATLPVHGPVGGIVFRLGVMTYRVRGVVLDGGTGEGLAGVSIAKGGQVLDRTASDGAFSFFLANGTTELTASLPSPGVVQYRSVPFTVTVAGGSTVHDVTLPRSVVPLDGVVVDAASGRAIPDATVTLWSSSGARLASAESSPDGTFGFGVAPGTYNVSVAATGYAPGNVSVTSGPAGNHTAIALAALVAVSAAGGRFPVPLLGLGAGVVVLVALVTALLWRRGRRPQGAGSHGPVDAEYRVVGGPTT